VRRSKQACTKAPNADVGPSNPTRIPKVLAETAELTSHLASAVVMARHFLRDVRISEDQVGAAEGGGCVRWGRGYKKIAWCFTGRVVIWILALLTSEAK
jgi:hypothetical protein